MKICTDCVHCRIPYKYHPGELGGWREYRYESAACGLVPNMVTGGKDGGRLCSEERSDESGCGPSAVNFEPWPCPQPVERNQRLGFWQRLFA